MVFRDILAKVGGWRSSSDNGGNSAIASCEPLRSDVAANDVAANDVVVRMDSVVKKKDSSELISEGFGKLIDQLEGINTNLDLQAKRHDALMDRINNLPELLNSLPKAAESQRQIAQALVEQMKEKSLKEQQFVEAIEKIPTETLKQTNTLAEMNRTLSVSADIDAQMGETFNKFNDTVAKLCTGTEDQSESIRQMNKTFAASDRYLKYLITKQNRRFMWMFITTAGVCAFAIAVVALCVVTILQN